MGVSGWLGIGAGALVVGGHAALRLVTHRLALQASGRRAFLLYELGGLGARMTIVFAAVAVGVPFLPVHTPSFVATVIVLLLVSMVIETRAIFRRMKRGTLGS